MLRLLDLPYFLRQLGGYKRDVKVVAVVNGEIDTPQHVKNMPKHDNSKFILADIVGLVLDDGTKYFVKGQMISMVQGYVLSTCRNKTSGRAAFVFNGGIGLARGTDSLIQMINMTKRNNVWTLYNTKTDNFEKDMYPEYFDVIMSANNNNWEFTYPMPIPNNYMIASDGYEFSVELQVPKKSTPSIPIGGIPIPPADAQLNRDSDIGNTGNTGNPWGVKDINAPIFNGTAPIGMNLGLSTKSDIGTIIDNKGFADEVRAVKKAFTIEGRKKMAEPSKSIKIVENSILEADDKVADLLENLETFADKYSIDDDIARCASKLKENWRSRKNGLGTTGKALFKEALERTFPDYKVKGSTGMSLIDTVVDVKDTDVLDIWVGGHTPDEENKLLDSIATSSALIYLNILELLLGIRGSLQGAYEVASENGGDVVSIMKSNPYYLCMIDNRFKTEDLDKLAMLYGVDMKDQEVIKLRNIAYMHNFMLDSNNVGDNTAIKYGKLSYCAKVGYTLPSYNYNLLQQTGYILKDDNLADLKTYINTGMEYDNFKLPKNGWHEVNRRYMLDLGTDTKRAISDYIKSGLGVTFDLNGVLWISDFSYAKKEMYIHKRLYELSESTRRSKNITDEQIEEVIKAFEEMKRKELNLTDFKLEERQADAVRMIRERVMALTGPAGSGKTMTAEALVFAGEQLLGLHPEEIFFCGPTGKSANKLKEVVKRMVRTINSLFNIGGDNPSLRIGDTDKVRKKSNIKLLVVDETSMPNTDLMYNMLMKIDDDTRIFFLGDIEQLPPIGFGKPFANILRFIPCVVLNVTKRASDKSGITRNAKEIIYNSDGPTIDDLVDTDDFRIIHETDHKKVVNYVADICMYHLGKGKILDYSPVKNVQTLNADDIQVISPVTNPKFEWGATQLNLVLQDIFNPRDPKQFYVKTKKDKTTEIEFRFNDRVIHTKNESDCSRLTKTGKNSFERFAFETRGSDDDKSKGIMNGDVGKIEGLYHATDLDFSDSDFAKELQDEFNGNENVYYLAVKYKDVDLGSGENLDFIVLYRLELLQKISNCFNVISYELAHLDLAYALTTHKLQGSQAKLTISVILPVRTRGFISRNMIYTMLTRAQKSGYVLGDVLGRNSAVNQGRRIEQTSLRTSVLDNA